MNENLKKFIQEEVQKLYKITLLEEAKKQIEKDLKLLEEGKMPSSLSEKKWMQKAFEKKKGSLHQTLDVPKDEKISDTKISAGYGKSKDTDAKIRVVVNANPEEYPQTKAKIKAQSEKKDKK